VASGESAPHFNDRNLHAGTYKGQTFLAIIGFDMATLAPGSKIFFAEVELTGLNRANLSVRGDWSLELLSSESASPGVDLQSVSAQGRIGRSLSPENLAEGQVNQFIFAADQLPRLEEALNGNGRIHFRLSGPTGSGDNLFTWDGSDPNASIGAHPVLRVIAAPAEFVFITNTPAPQNVLTAAAIIFQGTQIAQRNGTPTLLPRKFATSSSELVVTPLPTPANSETAAAQAAYATAVAVTTGTFTPTPLNWITTTPVPLLIAVEPTGTPAPTATPTLSKLLFSRKPLPSTLYGKIAFLGGSRSAPSVFLMDPDGKNVLQLTNPEVYNVAAARDNFSPDGNIEAFNAPDQNDILQIWLQDYTLPKLPTGPILNQMTFQQKGIAFAPTWSPDQKKIAFTSTEARFQEIYVMDVDSKKALRLTNTNNEYFWNQFPSWSPDGKQIVYDNDRGHTGSFTEIWLMNADGTGQHKLLDWGRDSWSPVWLKWRQ
jgi:hypothetical protein